MKKYIKYKDFLPYKYIEKNISKNKKSNKKAIWMLVILNFYMLPMNIRSFFKDNSSDKVINETYYNENEKFIGEISERLDIAYLDINSIEATRNKGVISTINNDILCDIENYGYRIIKITQENSIYKANIIKDD